MTTESVIKSFQSEQVADQFPVSAKAIPSLIVDVGDGRIRLPDGSYYSFTGTPATAFPAFGADDRWDWVCFDTVSTSIITSGDDVLLKGTEGAAIDWYDSVSVIPPQYVPVAACRISSSGVVTSADIVDARSFVQNTNNFGWKVLNPGSLNSLLSKMVAGDKYLLLPGTYTVTSKITLLDNVWLIGSGRDGDASTTISVSTATDYGIQLSDNCKISNLLIDGGANDSGGISISGVTGATVEDLAVTVYSSGSLAALYVSGVAKACIRNCSFSRKRSGDTYTGYTVKIESSAYLDVCNLVISTLQDGVTGASGSLSCLYIGGSSVLKTTYSTFRNIALSSPGSMLGAGYYEYCDYCEFDNISGNNSGVTSTQTGDVYCHLVSSCNASKFSLITTNFKSTAVTTGLGMTDCNSCDMTYKLLGSSTYNGVAPISAGALKHVYGVYLYSNTSCRGTFTISGSDPAAAGTHGAGVYGKANCYGANVSTNTGCTFDIIMSGTSAGFGLKQDSTGTVYGVHTTGNISCNLNIQISGSGAGSYGLLRDYGGAPVWGIHEATSQSINYTYIISGISGGYGIYCDGTATGCLFLAKAVVKGNITGYAGVGIESSAGDVIGIECYTCKLDVAFSGTADDKAALLSSAGSPVIGIDSADASGTGSSIKAFFGAWSIRNYVAGVDCDAVGIRTMHGSSICGCSLVTSAIRGFSSSTGDVVGILIASGGLGNTIAGNVVQLPDTAGGGTPYSIYMTGTGYKYNCITGNNCGGEVTTNNYIFTDASGAQDSLKGNVPNDHF